MKMEDKSTDFHCVIEEHHLLDTKTNDKNNNDNDNEDSDSNSTNQECCIKEIRSKISHFVQHNHKFHLFVTALVVVDVAVIIVQLILEASRKPHCHTPTTLNILNNNNNSLLNSSINATASAVHSKTTIEKIEYVLHYVSISVLSVFMIEIIIKLFAFGVDFFHHKLEILDAVVVTVAFFLDLFMSKEAVDDAIALLVLVRLWRILHIVSGVVEKVQVKAEQREKKLRLQLDVLQRELDELKGPVP